MAVDVDALALAVDEVVRQIPIDAVAAEVSGRIADKLEGVTGGAS